MKDVIFAWRTLRANLGFTAVAVITLALGVGANTAIFSVVKAVLLNQLPYAHAERVVAISEWEPAAVRPENVDFTTTHDLRERSRSFTSLSLYRSASAALVDRGEPELINGSRVNHDFFATLGVTMQLGRAFLPEEDRPDRRYEIILSHDLWMRRFGGEVGIVGRTIRLNDSSYKVVGILPSAFRPADIPGLDDAPEMFMPLGYDLKLPNACRGCQHLHLVGRLKAGVDVATAEAELKTIMGGILREHPDDYHPTTTVAVSPLRDRIVGHMKRPLWVLLAAVGFVLLIACANVANLLLARATGRTKEIALRAALGAARARIVRQLLTESALLALAGGVAGVLFALFATSALTTLAPKEIPRVGDVRIDGWVVLFALVATMVTGVLFGLAPALRLSRTDLNDALKGSGRTTADGSRHRLRNVLVTGEIALAFVLAMGAALLGRSLLLLISVSPGFEPHNVLTLNTYVYGSGYQKPEAELSYYKAAMNRVRAIPGIESVAMTSELPLSGGFDRRGFQIQNRHVPAAEAPNADTYSVSTDYFKVMKIPVKRGRIFTDQDRNGTPLVAVISESCARSQFPDRNPIGEHIQLGGRNDNKPWMTIVGIVGDVRQYALDRAPKMEAYIAQAQSADLGVNYGYTVVARTTMDPRFLAKSFRDAFLSADRTQPVYDVMPLDAYLASSLAERTFTLTLLGVFGALALALSAVGIYGVVSYSVSLRTREVGIRIALGAERRDVLALILGQGVTFIAGGLAAGFLISLAVTRFLGSLLYEVRSSDLTTSLLVAGVMGCAALLASYVPARRAMRVDPMVALRLD